MNGNEFLRKLGKLAPKKGVVVRFIADEGNGSHGRVYFGAESTTLKDRKKESGIGLLVKCAVISVSIRGNCDVRISS